MDDFGLKENVIDFIVKQARDLQMDSVILFGSRANGTYANKSDIDLAIRGQRYHDFVEVIDECCPTLLSFDFIDLSANISDELRRRIDDEGVTLYG